MDKREQERKELDLLLERGVTFTVPIRTRKGLLGRAAEGERHYIIQQPTLATLDRLSAEQMEMDIDDKTMTGAGIDAMAEARAMAARHARRMARMVAVAVLGEDLWKVTASGRRREDAARLGRLTDILYHGLSPEKLRQVCGAILQMSNLSDFMVSMRLMSAHRTTEPMTGRVE